MSNKKNTKRVTSRYQSKFNSPTTKTWKNEDGSFTTAIPVPSFMIDTNIGKLLFNACSYLHQFLVNENVANVTPEEWDKLADEHEFCKKVQIRWINDYAQLCVKYLNLNMYEYAPKFVKAVEELCTFENSMWMDMVTEQTGLKSNQLPILASWTMFINNHIEECGEKLYNHWKQFTA